MPLAEPGLASSRIGILVPRHRRLSPPARLMINHISERLGAFGAFLAAPPRRPKRRGRPDMAIVLSRRRSSPSTPPTASCRRPTSASTARHRGDRRARQPGAAGRHHHRLQRSPGDARPDQRPYPRRDRLLSRPGRRPAARILVGGLCRAGAGALHRRRPRLVGARRLRRVPAERRHLHRRSAGRHGPHRAGDRADGHPRHRRPHAARLAAPADWKTADAVLERFGTDPANASRPASRRTRSIPAPTRC